MNILNYSVELTIISTTKKYGGLGKINQPFRTTLLKCIILTQLPVHSLHDGQNIGIQE